MDVRLENIDTTRDHPIPSCTKFMHNFDWNLFSSNFETLKSMHKISRGLIIVNETLPNIFHQQPLF